MGLDIRTGEQNPLLPPLNLEEEVGHAGRRVRCLNRVAWNDPVTSEVADPGRTPHPQALEQVANLPAILRPTCQGDRR